MTGEGAKKSEISVANIDTLNTNSQQIKGIELISDREYSAIRKDNSGNQAKIEGSSTTYRKPVTGYSMPYTQTLTVKYNPTIDTNNDLSFLMSPIVAGTADKDIGIHFVMALCDGDGSVVNRTTNASDVQGFSSINNYISWEFSRSYASDNVGNRILDSGFNENMPMIYQKSSSSKLSKGIRIGKDGVLVDLLQAFCAMPEFRDNHRNQSATWPYGGAPYGNYLNTLPLVKTNFKFDNNNKTFTLFLDHTYYENINQACFYSGHKEQCYFEKTYNYDDLGFTDSSNLKLYFGYYCQNSCFSYAVNSSDSNVNEIPMSLKVYNLENGSDESKVNKFCDLFNNSNLCGFDDYTPANIDIWNNLKNNYENITTVGAREIFKNANGLVGGSSLEECIAKYDRVLEIREGFDDFMNRIESGKIQFSKRPIAESMNKISNKSKIGIFVIFTATSLILISICLIFRKKKYNN